MSKRECNAKISPDCKKEVTRHASTGACFPCSMMLRDSGRVSHPAIPPKTKTVAEDRSKLRAAEELASLKARYAEALKTIEAQEQSLEALGILEQAEINALAIEPKQGSGTSEGTAVVLASDWHIEERVGAEVGDFNRYSIEIAEKRVTKFFQGVLRLTRLLQQDIQIDNMVLALLGDFITNQIHEAENAESNNLLPTDAIVKAQEMIIGGIDFLLNHTKLDFTLPCHSGNHARTTKTTRFSSENGHSLEYLMFRTIEKVYRHEPRVKMLIPAGMHSYLDIYGKTVRFHHGHSIKYGGGVGGIYIPTHKAIAQWSKAKRADLDCFGHFHQQVDGGNFLCNGSLIGYNAFALAIKASFEPPRQTLFLMDKRRGRTCNWPVLVE